MREDEPLFTDRERGAGDRAARRGFRAAIQRPDGTACVLRASRVPAAGAVRFPGSTPGEFADDLPRYAAALRRAVPRAAVRAFALICHQVRVQAEAIGLETLRAAAAGAIRDVRRTRDLSASGGSVEGLARACERAAATLARSAG